ncbi:MAG: RIP metalloprotease RseP, partial [Candidatus Cloacimonadota bacterium]|nr:RIP metalloprotease RseP [Candidatus Cloacimonadota bacterium]
MSLFLWGFITLGLLVTIHEGGHMIVAKLLGVKVEKFSIGFGPKLISFKKGETEYRISLLPLGGYVKMKGETPLDETRGEDDEFLQKKWWEKALIAFAGPFANLIFAIILFSISFTIGHKFDDFEPIIGKIVNSKINRFQTDDRIIYLNNNEVKGWNEMFGYFEEGENTFEVIRNQNTVSITTDTLSLQTFANTFHPKTSTIVGSVAPGYPAYLSGVKKGDKIIKVNEFEVDNWFDLRTRITSTKKETVDITLIRDEKTLNKTIKLSDNLLEEGTKIIGVTQYLPLEIAEKFSPLKSIQLGVLTTISTIYANYYGLVKLIKNPSA